MLNKDEEKEKIIRHCHFCGDTFVVNVQSTHFHSEIMEIFACENCGAVTTQSYSQLWNLFIREEFRQFLGVCVGMSIVETLDRSLVDAVDKVYEVRRKRTLRYRIKSCLLNLFKRSRI